MLFLFFFPFISSVLLFLAVSFWHMLSLFCRAKLCFIRRMIKSWNLQVGILRCRLYEEFDKEIFYGKVKKSNTLHSFILYTNSTSDWLYRKTKQKQDQLHQSFQSFSMCDDCYEIKTRETESWGLQRLFDCQMLCGITKRFVGSCVSLYWVSFVFTN